MIGVVDLDGPLDTALDCSAGVVHAGGGQPDGIIIAVGSTFDSGLAEYWLDRASFTLADDAKGGEADRRVVSVASVADTVAEIAERCRRWPLAAAICDDVLRSVDPAAPAVRGVITESLGYSTLQGGPEFTRWLEQREPAALADATDPVLVTRDNDTLRLRLNRPGRHNAFSDAMRAGLLDGLTVACLDSSIDHVVLSGAGPSFCSGGDLAEFGGFADVASAHLARTRHSPGLALDALARRLGARCRADVHGQVLGSGLELAAYCGWVRAHPGTVLGLPELGLGLIPGAGGTVSVTRRIGRWRTAYLVLSGRTIDAPTALRWGLVDEIVDDAAEESAGAGR